MPMRIFAIAAVLLAGAGLLQTIAVGDGLLSLLASPAEAAETEDSANQAADGHDEEAALPAMELEPAPAAPAPAPAPAQSSFSEQIGASAEEYRILISLQERRRELEQREAALDTRARVVEAAELRVQEQLEELKSVRAEIEVLLGQLDEQEEARVASLVATYEKMKSKDAARILAGLESDTALMVIARLKDATRAAVMGEMETPDAKRLTELLAEQTNPFGDDEGDDRAQGT